MGERDQRRARPTKQHRPSPSPSRAATPRSSPAAASPPSPATARSRSRPPRARTARQPSPSRNRRRRHAPTAASTRAPRRHSRSRSPTCRRPQSQTPPSVAENDPAGVIFNVLSNDTDPEGDPLSIASYDDSTLANGSVTSNGGGSFTYIARGPLHRHRHLHLHGQRRQRRHQHSAGHHHCHTRPRPACDCRRRIPHAPGHDPHTDSSRRPRERLRLGRRPSDRRHHPGRRAQQRHPQPRCRRLIRLHPEPRPHRQRHVHLPRRQLDHRPLLERRGHDHHRRDLQLLAALPDRQPAHRASSGTSVPPRPAPSLLVPDYDFDLAPGLSIKSSDGKDKGEAAKSQTWRYPLASPLTLNGPVTLHLSSTQPGAPGDGTAYAYLYDCTAGGATCTRSPYGQLAAKPWNGPGQWAQHDFTVGTVNRTLAAGHELRLRLYVGQGDQWIAMTAALPTSLTLTTP